MQENTTRVTSSRAISIFHTQIHYNLCHRLLKILLRSYQEYLSPSMVLGVDIFMTTKKFQHCGRIILSGFIHHNLLSEWF
jgi:hypothetical protein